VSKITFCRWKSITREPREGQRRLHLSECDEGIPFMCEVSSDSADSADCVSERANAIMVLARVKQRAHRCRRVGDIVTPVYGDDGIVQSITSLSDVMVMRRLDTHNDRMLTQLVTRWPSLEAVPSGVIVKCSAQNLVRLGERGYEITELGLRELPDELLYNYLDCIATGEQIAVTYE